MVRLLTYCGITNEGTECSKKSLKTPKR